MAFPFQDDIRSALCGALAVMTKPTFPRDSRTGVKISAFPASLEARREVRPWMLVSMRETLADASAQRFRA
jgi:hypothetical protein